MRGLISLTRLGSYTELLEIYGPNVVTTEAKTFRFHLRIVAPPFADGTGANELVWNETKLQTRRLAAAWHKQTSSSLQLDVNGLTLAVIAKAGFGHELEWKEESGASANFVPLGYTISFLEAMTMTAFNMIPVLLLPRWLMYITPLRQAAIAHNEFERYLRQMIREEKHRIEESKGYESASARGNLLTSVLRASADEASKTTNLDNGILKKQAFTETEVMGNLFLYLLAGYETTANAILYGLICLALYPEVQDRIIEEVDSVYAQAAEQGRSELTYADDFEKFKYTYGFMVCAPQFSPFPPPSCLVFLAKSNQHCHSRLVRDPPSLPCPSTNHKNSLSTNLYHPLNSQRPPSRPPPC